MALRGHAFDKQLFASECYALMNDTFLDKNSGIVKGCELLNTSSSITIEEGYFVVKGRPIQEEGGITFDIETGSLDGIYCILVCEVNMTKTNTTTECNQIAYRILEDTTDYPSLTQEDITDGGEVYQFEFARFRRTINGIEDFVDTRSFLNFDSIYTQIQDIIASILDGSIFALKSETLKFVKIGEFDDTENTNSVSSVSTMNISKDNMILENNKIIDMDTKEITNINAEETEQIEKENIEEAEVLEETDKTEELSTDVIKEKGEDV